MTDETMYEQQFGPDGVYAWPADPDVDADESLDVAETFIEAAPGEKSSWDCLNDYFFYESVNYLDQYLFDEFPEDEAEELAKAAAKSRQELFKDARSWPWPYLVASAVYKILSAEGDKISVSGDLLWLFLCFHEFLFDMLRAKSWDQVYKNEMREGFKRRLSYEIRGYTIKKFIWGIDKDKPWFTWLTYMDFPTHIYPQDVLKCLELVGIDQGLAESAVDEMFRLRSLTPLYNVLCDDSSRMLGPEI